MKQRKADFKRKLARLRALEGTQCESEKRMHSAQATLSACVTLPGFLTGSYADRRAPTHSRRSFRAQRVTASGWRALWWGGQYLNPPF